ncbi:hypothetical protein EMCRGX_G000181 [Ephydatia muelleri]
MAKPLFAVGNKVVSKLKATYGKEGEILQVSGSSRSRKYTVRWSCGTVSTASTKGICHVQGHAPVLPQKRSATRKRQAKRPCLGTEVVAENEGCTCSFSAHAAMDNIVDENSTDRDSSNDSDSSSSGEDVNAQRKFPRPCYFQT